MRIGAFSKYVKTTVKTLRYYDRIGLFCPSHTDPATGYRNYTVDQIADFEQIRQYRTAGLSVEQIVRIRAGEDRESILSEHQRQIVKHENLLRRQKEAVATLLNASVANTYTVHQKELPSYTVCTCKTRAPDAAGIPPACSDRFRQMKQVYSTLSLVQPNYCCVTFTDTSHRDTDIEIEYAEAVTSPLPDQSGFVFKTLPGGPVACVEHYGAYETISDAYTALFRWLTASGYQMAGAVRERFIHGAWDRDNEKDWLTEVQVPLLHQGGKL